MSDKIKYSDLVEPGAFEKLFEQGQKLIDMYTKVGDVMKTALSNQKSNVSASSPKSVNDVENLNASIKKTAEYSATLDKINEAKKRLTLETAKAKQEEANYNAIVKNAAKDELGMISLYQKESIALNDLRKQYKDMVLLNKQNTEAGKALLNNITQLDTKLKAVDATVGQHQRNVGNYTSSLQDAKAGLMEIGGALGIAFGTHQVIDFGKESVKAFLEAEKNAKDLENSLHGNVAAFDRLMKQSAELQKNSIFSDDDIQQAQKALSVYGLTADQIEKITPQVADLASKLNIDLASATDKVISGINGQAKGLKEAGIAFKDTGSKTENFNILTEKLTKFQGASAEALETTIGKAKRLQNVFDDFKENVGEMLVNEGANLLDFFDGLANGMDKVVAKRSQEELVKGLKESNAKILEDARKSEAARLDAIRRTEKGIAALAEDGLKARDLNQKKIAASAIKNQQELLQALKHLNDKQAIEDDATNAAKLGNEEDFAKKLRDLKTQNEKLDYERRRQEILNAFDDETEKYKGHTAILIELEKKKNADLEALWKEREAKNKKILDQAQKDEFKRMADAEDPALNPALVKKMTNAEKEKKENEERRKKEIQDELDLADKVLSIYEEKYQKLAAIKREALDHDIESTQSNMEIQASLAARGLDNTLAYETKKKNELEKQRLEQEQKEKKHAEAMEAAELGLLFFKALENHMSGGESFMQASGEALGEVAGAKILSKAIAGAFATGVENFQGEGTGTSDSNLIAFSNGESVVTAKGTAETEGLVSAINKEGYQGAVDWAMKNIYQPQFNSVGVSDIGLKNNEGDAIVGVLVKKLDSLEQTIKNKPETSFRLDELGNLIRRRTENGKTLTTIKQRWIN